MIVWYDKAYELLFMHIKVFTFMLSSVTVIKVNNKYLIKNKTLGLQQ